MEILSSVSIVLM